jgi:hypothetical protein
VAAIRPDPSMRDAWHFLTHAVFAPDGRRFAFLHRWVDETGGHRHSRLVTGDLAGREWCVFHTTGMVSHLAWKDSRHLVAYCATAGHTDGYALFRDLEPRPLGMLGAGHLRWDGHMSFEPTGRWMVTDTYPDRRRRQDLILFDTVTARRFLIARLPVPKVFTSRTAVRDLACDLHPRWSVDGTRVCFDSAHTGERSLCTLHLGEDVIRGHVRSLAD